MISLPWVYALLSIAGAVPLSSLGSGSEQAHSSINLTNVPASGISGVLVPRWTELNHHEHEKRATVQTTEEQETVYDGGDGEKAHLKTELRGLIASRISSASKTSASPPPAEDPESDIVKQHQQHQQFCDPQPQSLQIWKLANGYEMVGELVGMKEDTMTFRQQGSYFTWPKKAFMPSDVARASRMQQSKFGKLSLGELVGLS